MQYQDQGLQDLIFLDFSAEVQKQKAKYIYVKKKLCHLQLLYVMLYSAKLRITARREAHFFDNPQAAYLWPDRNEQHLSNLRDSS